MSNKDGYAKDTVTSSGTNDQVSGCYIYIH